MESSGRSVFSGFTSWGFCDLEPEMLPSSSSSSGIPFDHNLYASGPDLHRFTQHQQHQYRTILKKRRYCGNGGVEMVESAATKRAAGSVVRVSMPRCQVEGCDESLVDAKDYHKRHKVCEMHSKAPCVVVLGVEQRFCQQCSRFHSVSEFDDAKRSCRRRLAGHNERRRKNSNGNSSLESTIMSRRFSFISKSPCSALSLLSSKAAAWTSTPELSSQSSAALRELIAENRNTLFSKQSYTDHSSNWQFVGQTSRSSPSYDTHQHQFSFQIPAQVTVGCNHFQGSGDNHLTLDLMQMPSSVEFLAGKNKSEDEDECCEIWKAFETHVV